jgi:GNAT superfamily N-acetyltransferase
MLSKEDNMDINEATPKDVAEMVKFGKQFWTQTSYYREGVEYDFEAIRNMTISLIDNGIVLVARHEGAVVGLMLMMVGHMPFNPSTLVATELVYYVDPDYRASGAGQKLLRMAEKIAAKRGVKYISMIHLDSVEPERAEAVYSKMGYSKTETLFSKDIS